MCEQRERVLDYLYNEASAASRSELEEHFLACDDCRDDMRAFRRVREDLLAWDVPEPASVWTPFAPAPVVPWFRQVPAWAMAAAAGLMFVVGGAGASTALAIGSARGAEPAVMAAVPVAVPAEPALDAQAIASLVRQELSSARAETTARMTPVATAVPAALKLDAATERRLLAQTNQLVGASEERQMSLVRGFLFEVALEAERQRRDDGQRLGALQAQVNQLQDYVNQLLVLQQTKVQ